MKCTRSVAYVAQWLQSDYLWELRQQGHPVCRNWMLVCLVVLIGDLTGALHISEFLLSPPSSRYSSFPGFPGMLDIKNKSCCCCCCWSTAWACYLEPSLDHCIVDMFLYTCTSVKYRQKWCKYTDAVVLILLCIQSVLCVNSEATNNRNVVDDKYSPVCCYCRLSLADKMKIFSGKKTTGKSMDSGVKTRRRLPRFQTQVIAID